MSELAAVVVTWNSAGVIEACLASLAGQVDELVVVDNASADDTAERARAVAPKATVIVNDRNLGLAAANNIGLRKTRTDVVICNPDVEFRPGSVAAMQAVMGRHPRAGWVVPRLRQPDGTLQTSAGDPPTLAGALLGRQAARRRAKGPGGFWWDGWLHDEERAVGRGHEAAYLVRRAAIDEVGLQDERYVLDWEGMDWGDRFSRAGWETWLAPDAEVLHRGGDSLRQVPYRAIVSHHRGMYRYFADRRRTAWRPALAGAFAVRAAIKVAATAAGRPLYAGDSARSRPPNAGPAR